MTSVLLKEWRGSEQYQVTNSSMLRLYSRCEPGDERLPNTAASACSRSWKAEFGLWTSELSLVPGLHGNRLLYG
jgi:uracil-DNA glycosylase